MIEPSALAVGAFAEGLTEYSDLSAAPNWLVASALGELGEWVSVAVTAERRVDIVD